MRVPRLNYISFLNNDLIIIYSLLFKTIFMRTNKY